MVVQVLSLPELELDYIAKPLHWLFLLLPHYSMCTGLRDLNTIYSTHSLCQTFIDTCIEYGSTHNNDTMNPLTCPLITCKIYKPCCSKFLSKKR